MTRYGLLLSLTLFLEVSCASSSSKEGHHPAPPSWVQAPSQYCQSARELCSVGYGPSRSQAEAKAKEGMAQQFRTQISSKKTLTSRSQQVKDQKGLRGSHHQWMAQAIQESTHEILSGVELTDFYQDPQGLSYVLAKLNKRKAADLIRQEHAQIEKELRRLLSSPKARGKRLKRLKAKQLGLSEKYLFLMGTPLLSKVSLETVSLASDKKSTHLYIDKETQEKYPHLWSSLKTGLLNNDFRMTPKKKEAHLNLSIELLSEEEFMKVRGFKRYHFSLTLNFKKSDGKVIHSINEAVSENGRTLAQAQAKAITFFKMRVLKKLDRLDLDNL